MTGEVPPEVVCTGTIEAPPLPNATIPLRAIMTNGNVF
jgi:hypothetical protein